MRRSKLNSNRATLIRNVYLGVHKVQICRVRDQASKMGLDEPLDMWYATWNKFQQGCFCGGIMAVCRIWETPPPESYLCQLHMYVVSKRCRHDSKNLCGYASEESSSQTESIVRHADELANDVAAVSQLRPCRPCVCQRLAISQMSTDGLGARHARARRRPFTGRVPSSTWRVWS